MAGRWWPLVSLGVAFIAGLYGYGIPAACAQTGGHAAVSTVVARVEIDGLQRLPEAEVRPAVALKPGDPATPELIEASRKALLGLGFFRSVRASHKDEGTRTYVTYHVVEWPPVLVIRFAGNTLVDQRSLLESISSRPGEVLCTNRLKTDVDRIEELYHQRGYVARVSEKLLRDAARTGELRFEILEVHIGEVTLEGGDDRLRERCRAALHEKPPVFYRPEAVARDQERLLRIRGVHTAVPRVEPVTPGNVRVRWTINGPQAAPSSPGTESAVPIGSSVLQPL